MESSYAPDATGLARNSSMFVCTSTSQACVLLFNGPLSKVAAEDGSSIAGMFPTSSCMARDQVLRWRTLAQRTVIRNVAHCRVCFRDRWPRGCTASPIRGGRFTEAQIGADDLSSPERPCAVMRCIEDGKRRIRLGRPDPANRFVRL